MKKVFYVLVVMVAFIAGMEFNSWYYNIDSLYEANAYKKSQLEMIDSIIDSHADDGVCDQLVDELNECGYYNK